MTGSMIENKRAFDSSDITALSHLYRGELYRSTVWRTRLDATTNWAVLTTGIALSLTFSSEHASPLPLVLVGLLVVTFLFIEARRYRFFDFWRMRAHVLEVQFFGPILRGEGVQTANGTGTVTAQGWVFGPVSPSTAANISGVVQLVSAARLTFADVDPLNGDYALITTLKLHFVPEPGQLLLLGCGSAALLLVGRGRMRR